MNEWMNERRTNAKMNELGFELMPLKLGSRLNGNLAWTESHESNIIDLKTLCYKACTNKLPVQLCTTKLAQSTPSALLCISLYYKACTGYFPVQLRTTNFAQSTSQYCCVL